MHRGRHNRGRKKKTTNRPYFSLRNKYNFSCERTGAHCLNRAHALTHTQSSFHKIVRFVSTVYIKRILPKRERERDEKTQPVPGTNYVQKKLHFDVTGKYVGARKI